jgi:iron complex outermembrane receptor protein
MKFYKIVFLFFIIISTENIFHKTFAQKNDTVKLLPVFEVQSEKISTNQSVFFLNLEKSNKIYIDLSDALKSFPNLSAIRRGGTALDPVMRGFRNNQIMILLDNGIRIEGGCPNRMDPVTSHIPAEEIEEIQVLQGTDMLKYGPAIGGTIILKSYFPEFTESKKYGFGYNTVFQSNPAGNNHFFNSFYSSKKLALRISGGYSNFGDYTSGSGEKFKTSFKKFNTTIKSGFKITDNQIIKLQMIGSFAKDVMFPALPMDEKKDNTYIANLSYHLINNDNSNIKISVYHSNVEHLMDNSFRPQFTTIVPPLTGIMQAFSNVDAYNTGGNISYETKWKNIKLTSKAEFEHIYKDGTRKRSMIMNMSGITTVSTKFDNLWNQANIYNSAVSLSATREIDKNNIIESVIRIDNSINYSSDTFGLKQDDVSLFDKSRNSNTSLSLGIQYIYKTGNFTILTGLSRSIRNANMNELYIKRLVIGFDNYDYLGNPFLKPETNNQADIRFNFNNKRVNLQLNGFYDYIQNYIGGVLLPSSLINPATQGVLGVKQFKNKGDAIFTGGELSSSFALRKNILLNFSLGYTYAFIKKDEKYIINKGQITGKVLVENDPLPEIPQLSSSADIQYFFNRNLSKLYFKLNYLMSQNTVSEANYEKTTPSSVTMDVELQHQLKKFVIIKSGIKNIFNTNYYEHLNRKIVGSNNYLYEPGRCFFIQLNFSINNF